MAAKKKTRKRQTTKRKPKNSTKYDSALNNLLGIVIILLMLLGLFNLGAIGTLVANLFRIIVGQTYPLMLVIITIYAVGLTFKGRWPHFNIRFLIGGFLAYIGLLLLFHGSMFNQLDRHSDFVAITWTNLNQDIIQGSIDMPVGGGMIGAYLYQLCYFF